MNKQMVLYFLFTIFFWHLNFSPQPLSNLLFIQKPIKVNGISRSTKHHSLFMVLLSLNYFFLIRMVKILAQVYSVS